MSQKLKIKPPHNSAILPLDTYLKELKSLYQKICSHSHVYCSTIQSDQNMEPILMSFTKRLSKEMWYIYAAEYYPPIKIMESCCSQHVWNRGTLYRVKVRHRQILHVLINGWKPIIQECRSKGVERKEGDGRWVCKQKLPDF